MNARDETFSAIEQARRTGGPAAALDALIAALDSQNDYHRLFDAILLKKKFEMGLPLARPASFDNVPEARQEEFEQAYVEAARRVGDALLAQRNIPQAWVYLRTIREPEKVARALEQLDADNLPADADELIAVALYERAHPLKGLELMLQTRGTCNTITAFDQAVQPMSAEDRSRGAELLARHLHGELLQSVCRDIERHTEKPFAATNLREAIEGREWLFDEGNYHVDVSHLSAVVRFARFLKPDSPALDTVLQLAEYGTRLSPQFQYAADPPFDAYYEAHAHFFRVLADKDRETSLSYFRERLASAVDPEDRRMIAYVLVDLLVRVGSLNDAVEIAGQSLADLDESSGFSLAQLCETAGRPDVFRKAAEERGDLVGFTAAIVAAPGQSDAISAAT